MLELCGCELCGFCVFVELCLVAEFFGVWSAEVEGGGECSYKVFGACGEEGVELLVGEGEGVLLGWWWLVGFFWCDGAVCPLLSDEGEEYGVVWL